MISKRSRTDIMETIKRIFQECVLSGMATGGDYLKSYHKRYSHKNVHVYESPNIYARVCVCACVFVCVCSFLMYSFLFLYINIGKYTCLFSLKNGTFYFLLCHCISCINCKISTNLFSSSAKIVLFFGHWYLFTWQQTKFCLLLFR